MQCRSKICSSEFHPARYVGTYLSARTRRNFPNSRAKARSNVTHRMSCGTTCPPTPQEELKVSTKASQGVDPARQICCNAPSRKNPLTYILLFFAFLPSSLEGVWAPTRSPSNELPAEHARHSRGTVCVGDLPVRSFAGFPTISRYPLGAEVKPLRCCRPRVGDALPIAALYDARRLVGELNASTGEPADSARC